MPAVYLMSIRPEYSAQIFAGTKTFELRRRPTRIGPGDVILVYETTPTCAVVGAFTVKGVRSGPPPRIWRDLLAYLGIARQDYDAYFAGAPRAYAIEIDDLQPLEPTALAVLRDRLDDFAPPQSYMRLDLRTLARLPRRIGRAVGTLAGGERV